MSDPAYEKLAATTAFIQELLTGFFCTQCIKVVHNLGFAAFQKSFFFFLDILNKEQDFMLIDLCQC